MNNSFRSEIDKEESITPAVGRMAKRIFTRLKYNFTVSSTEPEVENSEESGTDSGL